MERYKITLKNEKLKQYDKIALFMIIINLAIFIYLLFSTNNKYIKNTVTVCSILVIIALAIDYFLQTVKKNVGSPFLAAAEFHLTMSWILPRYWWNAGLFFLLGILYLVAKRPLLFNVTNELIIYPSFPKKQIAWSELNTLLIKDGLLTIEFRNNRFIQQMVDPAKTAVNEQEFNDFCRQQLNQ